MAKNKQRNKQRQAIPSAGEHIEQPGARPLLVGVQNGEKKTWRVPCKLNRNLSHYPESHFQVITPEKLTFMQK